MKQKAAPHIVNRSAKFEYSLGEDLVVGLELTGPEVRAARLGHVQLKGSYVTVRHDELWLLGATFSIISNQKGQAASKTADDRTRRLLAHRKEIDRFIAAKKQGMTIIPTKLLTEGRYIKLVIALGKGKKLYDKRQVIKQRDQEREHKKYR
jgi:SsrA-binding protein